MSLNTPSAPGSNMPPKLIYRKEALIRSVQPEALDDLPRVTAPHERIFLVALLVLLLLLVACAALVA